MHVFSLYMHNPSYLFSGVVNDESDSVIGE